MDRRDAARDTGKWYISFDQRTMTARAVFDDEDCSIKCHFDVCPVCDGKGTHVNPSIDSHGLTSEELHEDPDFAEDYFGGFYDVPCYHCDGKRVVPVPEDEADLNRLYEIEEAEYQYAKLCEAERRMGA